MLERILLLLGGIEVVLGGIMTAFPPLFPPWVAFIVIGIGVITIGAALYLLRNAIWEWLLQKALERERKTQKQSIEDAYAYGLALDNIDHEDRRSGTPEKIASRSSRFILKLRNTLALALEYEIKTFEIDGLGLTTPLSTGAIIPAQTAALFYSHWVPASVNDVDKAFSAIVIVEITYGAPRKHTRRIYKKMQVEVLPKSGRVIMLYEVNTDEPL